jgi:hypothetical protein
MVLDTSAHVPFSSTVFPLRVHSIVCEGFSKIQKMRKFMSSINRSTQNCLLAVHNDDYCSIQNKNFRIYLNARQEFYLYTQGLKFTYETPNRITLKPTMRNQTMASITKSSCEICTLWHIIQHTVVIPWQHFGTTHLQGSRNPKDRKEQDQVNWLNFIFWELVQRLIS